MREFYRWERACPSAPTLARDAVGAWIAEREALWSALEERAFVPLPCAPGLRGAGPVRRRCDQRLPAAAGPALRRGARRRGAPGLLSRRAARRVRREGLPVLSAGRELARGLLAPPAVLDGGGQAPAIVLRRESLARWCWEKFEAFSLRRADGQRLPCRCRRPTDWTATSPPRCRAGSTSRARCWCCTNWARSGPGAGSDPAWAACGWRCRRAAPTCTCVPCATIWPTSPSRCPRCCDRGADGVDPLLVRQLRRRARVVVPVAAGRPTRSGVRRRRCARCGGPCAGPRPLQPAGAAGAGLPRTRG